ncbi:MAG: cytochrome-c peroxidase [Rhizobiales bacterium]|nr:cytochrome-c peroxidase [Hyphomicrobiales bacterium]MBA68488.1 cytochrome-c peroxidase [Hyphomicrobiales bacterium]
MSTIQDVAKAASVSAATVSRYLNGRIQLPATTAARIDKAIKKLEYRPNVLAKRLSLGKSETLGFVTPEIGNPFFAELAAAAEDEASRNGYALFMTSTGGHRNREIDMLRRLTDRHFDGLIMMTNQPDDGTLAQAVNTHSEVVLIDEDIPGVHVPKVFVENYQGGRLAAAHLIAAGHERIAHIGGPAALFSAVERRRGFMDTMADAGLTPAPGHVVHGSYTRQFGVEAMRSLLKSETPPTAVFAGSDFIALGVMEVVAEAGLGVPHDISLVGFDDMMFANLLAPALTTVRQPTGELGRAGVRTLLAIIDKKAPPPLTRLPVALIERQSVAPPAGGKSPRI